MRICRFNDNRVGVVTSAGVVDVTDIVHNTLKPHHWPLPRYDLLIAALPDLKQRLQTAAEDRPAIDTQNVSWLSPVANPGKLIAAPVNYMAHVEESQQDPGIHFGTDVTFIERYALFLKATSSMVGASEGVQIHHDDGRRTDHEVELAVVIGQQARHIPIENALSVVAGYTIGLDITIRGTEDRSYRKSLDTFSVLGPWLVTADELGSPDHLQMRIAVNGEPRQNANTRDLIWNVSKLISVASHAYTLYPGDVIFTGTPEGVAPINRGDVMHAEIEKIGAMDVHVR